VTYSRSSTRDPQDLALAGRDLAEGLRTKRADRLAPDSTGRDEPGHPKALQVVAHERLGEPDMGDELSHARLASSETSNDAQSVHVSEGLVERPQVAEVIWPLALKVTGAPTFCQVRSPPTIGLLLRR